MTHRPCGCVNGRHPQTGILRSLAKCPMHAAMRRPPGELGEAYYTGLGVLKDGKLADTRHVAELTEALGEITQPTQHKPQALEIGCGVSPYAQAIIDAGYSYAAIEPSRWAAAWMRERYQAPVLESDFETYPETDRSMWFAPESSSLILACHSFEHMQDAPAAIAKAASLLRPGGELWILVPDDSDPCNPDHLWMFSAGTLLALLTSIGLHTARFAVRQHVPHEQFLYARAVKR